jgi:hypothetical protein
VRGSSSIACIDVFDQIARDCTEAEAEGDHGGPRIDTNKWGDDAAGNDTAASDWVGAAADWGDGGPTDADAAANDWSQPVVDDTEEDDWNKGPADWA